MGDDSIDAVLSHIDMGYLVTLAASLDAIQLKTQGCKLRGRSPCTLRNWKVQWCVPVCREQTTDTRPTGVELSNPKL